MNNAIIFFISIVMILLSVMLIFKIKLNFDLYGNYITIKICLYGIKIMDIYISIVGLYIQINHKKKLKTIDFVFDKEKEYLFLQMKKNILDKLYFDDIDFKCMIGIRDAGFSAIMLTIINQLCFNLKNKMICKNKDLTINYLNEPDFVYQRVLIDANVKVYFTIFDLVFAVLLSFYERGKYAKKRKKSK